MTQLTIEVGRTYATVDGQHVRITERIGSDFTGLLLGSKGMTKTYTQHGRASGRDGSVFDLVEEVDPPAMLEPELPPGSKARPWAREIKAWAEGAVIESRASPTQHWVEDTRPSWSSKREYRVKPSPITRWIPLLRMPAGSIVACEGKADRRAAASIKVPYGDTLHKILRVELTPDGRELIEARLETP